MSADRVSHYEILDKVGQGGMGIVYKARDPRLGRIIALKVLPPEHFADAARKSRLIQEARSASALNHPNIVTIHDIGEENGQPFIAMEYVAGRTLGQLIPRRGMKVYEVLRLGVQIADALGAAHRAGIIHRDLKPGNVMVTESGLVKVLDFGLAKVEPATPSSDAETRTRAVETDEGRIVGTVAYMSPEQAQGKPLDARSDIFSLGVMLYEMLTGHRPFIGDTPMSTAAAILNQEPAPMKGDGMDVALEVSKVVMRCLRKDPNRRFQTMADLKVVLEELKEESESGQLSAATAALRPSRQRSRMLAYTGAGLVLCFLAGAFIFLKKPDAPAQRTPIRITLDGRSDYPALSRDGKLLAYQSLAGGATWHIWVRQMAGGEAMQVTKGDDDDWAPSFSPDGTRIAYRSERDGGGIYTVPTFGGEPQLLVKGGYRPAFSPDGTEVLFRIGPRLALEGSLRVVSAQGGLPREVCPNWLPDFARWSPDGKAILFNGRRGDHPLDLFKWHLVAANGGEPKEFQFPPEAKTNPRSREAKAWTQSQDGREWIVYDASTGDSRNLFRIAVSAAGNAEGKEQQLTFGTGYIHHADYSADRQLVFSSGAMSGQVWLIPTDTDRAKTTGEPEQVTRSEGRVSQNPALSRDGRWLAYAAVNTGSQDTGIRLMDLKTRTDRELAGGAGWKRGVSISPDGLHVAYRALSDNKLATFLVAASGGAPAKICSQCIAGGFSSDGSVLLAQEGWSSGGKRGHIVAVRIPGGESKDLLKDPDHSLSNPFFSWDGRWVSFMLTVEEPRAKLMIAPVRDGVAGDKAEWVSVTDGNYFDDKPQLSPDGKTLYFYSGRDGHFCIWAQRLDAATKRPRGEPLAVQHFHNASMGIGLSSQHLFELWVAKDKLVTNLAVFQGDIWEMKLN